ncbi:alpha/beta hydrolase [Paenibacillus antibioticophila]|uniref:alpha/beta hydrolase n=1 Tax=Paenibacillus antibioticophila TaxID=1274374 RepID=UPI0005C84E62|nr:alpha/beta hydrolase-fold protein [Paenibacillus antibioticophila]
MTKTTALPWRDVLPGDKLHTITGDVRVIQAFPIPQLQTTRRVWIYLPRSYHEGTRRYPVLYMHDGQNVFDQATSWGNEWGVDETLEHMTVHEPELEVIVVAIDHGDNERNNEYNFAINSEYGFGGKGGAYAEFLAETLKPHIDSCYRTCPGPEHTMIGGSSFGAYISLYTALRFPDRFGRVSGISFVMWQDQGAMIQLIQRSVSSPALRLYLSIGELETDNADFNRTAHEHVELVRQTLLAAGVKDSQIRCDFILGGTHHESTWGPLFTEAHRWLLGLPG